MLVRLSLYKIFFNLISNVRGFFHHLAYDIHLASERMTLFIHYELRSSVNCTWKSILTFLGKLQRNEEVSEPMATWITITIKSKKAWADKTRLSSTIAIIAIKKPLGIYNKHDNLGTKRSLVIWYVLSEAFSKREYFEVWNFL